jgi:hypothetical protein
VLLLFPVNPKTVPLAATVQVAPLAQIRVTPLEELNVIVGLPHEYEPFAKVITAPSEALLIAF